MHSANNFCLMAVPSDSACQRSRNMVSAITVIVTTFATRVTRCVPDGGCMGETRARTVTALSGDRRSPHRRSPPRSTRHVASWPRPLNMIDRERWSLIVRILTPPTYKIRPPLMIGFCSLLLVQASRIAIENKSFRWWCQGIKQWFVCVFCEKVSIRVTFSTWIF